MQLYEKNSVQIYTRKKAADASVAASVIKSIVVGTEGAIIDATAASSHPPEVGLVVAEITITEGTQAEITLFKITNVFRGLETLGTCRRCGNAVRGEAGSKRVIFCKAKPIYGACGNYEFVTAIVDDCPRYEDSPVNGLIFDTEKVAAATLEKVAAGWATSAGDLPEQLDVLFEISVDRRVVRDKHCILDN